MCDTTVTLLPVFGFRWPWTVAAGLRQLCICAFSRPFYPKRLTVHSDYTFFFNSCVPWKLNPQPFAPLTQCSTTEPQEHWNWSWQLKHSLQSLEQLLQKQKATGSNYTLTVYSPMLEANRIEGLLVERMEEKRWNLAKGQWKNRRWGTGRE